MALDLDVDRVADLLPRDRFKLADQIRRAAQGVHSNIAEGHGRPSDRDFSRYVVMARGSLHEVESDMAQIRAASLAPGEAVAQVEIRIRHVEQLLAGLLRHLNPPPP